MTDRRWRVRIPLFLCLVVVAWFTWHSGPQPKSGGRKPPVAFPGLPGSFDELLLLVDRQGLAETLDVTVALGSERLDPSGWSHAQRERLVDLVLLRAERFETRQDGSCLWLTALDQEGFFGLLHVPRLLQERLWRQGPAVALAVGHALYQLALATERYEFVPAALALVRRHMLAEDTNGRVALGVLLAGRGDGEPDLDELFATVEAGERLPMLQWAVTMLRIGRWVGGERLWAFVERQRRASPELPERLLPLVLAAAVLTEGLPAGAGEAARQWLRTVPEDRGELAWDPPIDLHGLALGRTEAMTEFAARVRTEACLFALDERTTRPFLAGLVWLAQFAAAGEPAALRPFAATIRLAVDRGGHEVW